MIQKIIDVGFTITQSFCCSSGGLSPFKNVLDFLNHELDCAKHFSFGFVKILNLQLECLIFTIILIFLKIVSIIILC